MPQFIGARTPITLVLRASRARRGVGGHPAQPGRHPRQRAAQQTFSAARPATSSACSSSWPAARSACARARRTWSARARRLLAAHPRGRPMIANAADHARLHAAHPRDPGLHAAISRGGGGLVAVRANGRRARRGQRGRSLLPGFPAGASGQRACTRCSTRCRWNLAPNSPVTATAQDEAGNAVPRAPRGGHPPAQVPDGHHRGARAVPLRARCRSSPARARPDPARPAPRRPSSIVNRDKAEGSRGDEAEARAEEQALRLLFEGAFIQPRNTKVFSNFAETRTYRYQGEDVDTQVHLGYDLASLKNSAIPAANAGVVVYAAPLTIYGNTVVVDHGWGSRRSTATSRRIEVKEGDEVKKGQELWQERRHRPRPRRSPALRGAHPGRLGHAGRVVGRQVDPRPRRPLPLREANIPLLQSDQPAAGRRRRPPRRPPRHARAAAARAR